MTYHMSLDIEGALMNWDRNSHHGMTDNDGRPMTNLAAKAELLKMFGRGIRQLPFGDCPAFDPTTGCPGHPSEAHR